MIKGELIDYKAYLTMYSLMKYFTESLKIVQRHPEKMYNLTKNCTNAIDQLYS